MTTVDTIRRLFGGGEPVQVACDRWSEEEEKKHPRGQPKNAGQFGPGGGGGAGSGREKSGSAPARVASFASTKTEPAKTWTAKRITPEQKKAFETYTSNDYTAINGDLRTAKGNVDQSGKYADTVRHLDSALDNASYPGGTVYRGQTGRTFERWLKEGLIKPGEEITDFGFMSTSSDEKIASSFNEEANSLSSGSFKSAKNPLGVMFKISLPEGSRAAHVSDLSGMPDEKETLLARGTRLRIDKWDPQKRECHVTALPPIRIEKDRPAPTRPASAGGERRDQKPFSGTFRRAAGNITAIPSKPVPSKFTLRAKK